MDPKFAKNIPTLSEAEQQMLAEKRVLVAGCGGLGGYLVELLTRAGVGALTLADGDSFSLSNRNRQLLATEETLGEPKVRAAAARAKAVNPAVSVRAEAVFLDEKNIRSLLADCDLAVDALDHIPPRLLLADACAEAGLPLIHGAVHGWAAQAATVLPGSSMLRRLYAGGEVPSDSSVLSPVPALCAAVQCAEALKILTGRAPELAGKLLFMDLREMDWTIVEF